jgi:hypothetical protein
MFDTIKANTKGKITTDDMGKIIGIIGAEFQLQDSPDNEGWFRRWRMGADKANRERELNRKVFSQFKKWNDTRDSGSPDDPVQMTESIMAGIKKGDIPQSKVDEAVSQAIQVRKRLDNPTSMKYEIGQVITNPNGLKAEVTGFDDNGDPILSWKR